jgi:transcriptional regulator with XRE-family HTH domain
MQLGVNAGFDELSAGARISQYESGVHVPLIPIARHLARALDVPLAYLYCDEDEFAEALVDLFRMKPAARSAKLKALRP